MLYSTFRYLGKNCPPLALVIVCGVLFMPPAFGAPATDLPSTDKPVALPQPSGEADEPQDEDDKNPLSDSALSAPESATPAATPHTDKAGKNLSFGEYLSGRFAESQGDTDNGLTFLQDSLKRDPDNKEVLGSLYRMLILSGKIEDALPVAKKLVGVKVVEEGSEFTPEMLIAVDKVKQGDYAGAEKLLGTVPKAGFNTLLLPLMTQWLKLGENAIKEPLEAKNITPEARLILPHVYLNAALINDIAGFKEQAQKQYEAAVKDPRIEPFRAVEALANFYARNDNTGKRKQLVEDYLTAHGDSFLADEVLGESADAHAAPLVKDAKEGLAEVFYTMANIFHGVRAPADEIATLHLALYLRPDFPAAQFLAASAYELAGDYADAVTAYKGINEHSPYFMRGRIRGIYDESEIGNKAEALAKLDAIAAQLPHDVDALIAKGDMLRAQNHYKEAVGAYDEAAARANPPQRRHWVIFFSRGTCFERMGQWEKAEADMRKALVLQPGEPDVLNYLGYSFLTMHRNLTEAKKMIEEAYDARPEDPHIIDSMGYALYMTGDYTSAQEYFEQALERTPNDPTVNDHLGDTYWQQGRKTEARYQWERALSDEPDEETAKQLHTKLDKGLAAPLQAGAGDEKKPAKPAAQE